MNTADPARPAELAARFASEADRLASSGDREGALNCFRAACFLSPEDPDLRRRLGEQLYGSGMASEALEAFGDSYRSGGDLRSAYGAYHSASLASGLPEAERWLEEVGLAVRDSMAVQAAGGEDGSSFFRDTEYCSLSFSCLVKEGILDDFDDIVLLPEEMSAAEDICPQVCSLTMSDDPAGTVFAASLATATLLCGRAGAAFEHELLRGNGTPSPGALLDQLFLRDGTCSCTGPDEMRDRFFVESFRQLFRRLVMSGEGKPSWAGFTSLCKAMFLGGTVLERRMLGDGEWSGNADPAVLSREKQDFYGKCGDK